MKTYTPEQLLSINKACAELDGWRFHKECDKQWCEAKSPTGKTFIWWNPTEHDKFIKRSGLPKYTESHDAIIPLIAKQSQDIRWRMVVEWWLPENGDNQLDRIANLMWIQTPLQLAIYLLKAAGKLPKDIED